MSAKFTERRTYTQGDMTVQVGFKANELLFRVFLPGVHAASLTIDRANDLADLLDEAIDEHEEDPLT